MAMRPSIGRRELGTARRAHRELAAVGANLPRSGRQAVDEDADRCRRTSFCERGGRFRVRERTVIRYTRARRPSPRGIPRPPRTHEWSTGYQCLFHALARSEPDRLASTHGSAVATAFAPGFAGETVAEAIAAAAALEASGMTQTLDYLGESVATMAEADAATRAYLTIIDEIVRSRIGRNLCELINSGSRWIAHGVDNLRRILDAAPRTNSSSERQGGFAVHRGTLDIFETMCSRGTQCAPCAVVSAAKRRGCSQMNRPRACAPGPGAYRSAACALRAVWRDGSYFMRRWRASGQNRVRRRSVIRERQGSEGKAFPNAEVSRLVYVKRPPRGHPLRQPLPTPPKTNL